MSAWRCYLVSASPGLEHLQGCQVGINIGVGGQGSGLEGCSCREEALEEEEKAVFLRDAEAAILVSSSGGKSPGFF